MHPTGGSDGRDELASSASEVRAKPRVRVGFILALLPIIMCGGLGGGCVLFLQSIDDGCKEPVPLELVDDLPDNADVVTRSNAGRTCDLSVQVRARDGRTLALEDEIVQYFDQRGWQMAENSNGWAGTLPEDVNGRAYALSMDASDVSELSYPRETVRSGERRLSISIWPSEVQRPGGTTLSGRTVAGPWLGAPRFIGGRVLVPAGNRVAAYDAGSGAPLWTSDECDAADWAGPIINPDVDAAVFFCLGWYTRIDVETGRELWRYRTPGNVDRSRVAASLLLIAGSSSVTAVDLNTGAEKWSKGFSDATPTADRISTYVANDDGVVALDSSSGEQKWSMPVGSSDVWAGSDALYVRTNDHRLLRVDAASGSVIWSSAPEESRLDWSVIVAESDHAVVLETRHEHDRFTVFDSASGRRTWTYDAPDKHRLLGTAAGSNVVITDFSASEVLVMDDETGARRDRYFPVSDATAAAQDDLVALVMLDGDRRTLRLVRPG